MPGGATAPSPTPGRGVSVRRGESVRTGGARGGGRQAEPGAEGWQVRVMRMGPPGPARPPYVNERRGEAGLLPCLEASVLRLVTANRCRAIGTGGSAFCESCQRRLDGEMGRGRRRWTDIAGRR